MNNEYFDYDIETANGSVDAVVKVPKLCKYCNVIAVPELIWHTDIEKHHLNALAKGKSAYVTAVYSCSNCDTDYLYTYKLFYKNLNELTSEIYEHEIDYSYLSKEIPVEIEQISEKFRQIYSQSLIAEKENLDLIAGVGFRKSVEFLVKDYLINLLKEDEEKISKMPLSQAINKIENTRIKAVALAATWLGNDETHYEKKYTDKDINDMKRFIKSLTHHISSEIYTIEAKDFINENR